MSKVETYIDLPKGETAPVHSESCWACSHVVVRGQDGIEVEWIGEDPPPEAQVYLTWVPVAYAVWEEQGLQVE